MSGTPYPRARATRALTPDQVRAARALYGRLAEARARRDLLRDELAAMAPLLARRKAVKAALKAAGREVAACSLTALARSMGVPRAVLGKAASGTVNYKEVR